MNRMKKLLATLVIMVIICSNFSFTAFAGTTEDQTSTQDDAAVTTDSTDATPEDPSLGEGYYIDEQGQVCYDPSLVTEDETTTDTTVDETSDSEVTENEDATVEDSEDSEDSEDNEDSEDTDEEDTEAEEEEPSYTKSDLRLLSCLIYAEAGNQSYDTMLAVANVVLNRVDSDVYWHVDTIKEVIYDKKWAVQFSVTIKNSKTGMSMLDSALKAYDTGKYTRSNNQAAEKKAMNKAIKAAKDALNGKNNIGKYLCFSNKSYISYVKKHYSKYKIIGDMIFYRSK